MSNLPAAAAAVAILSAFAGQAFATDYQPPFPPVVTSGDQTRLIYPDSPTELVVTEQETGGQFGMLVIYAKQGEGPPENILIEQKLTETFYVLDGQFQFHVGDDTYKGGPGTIVVNPPKVPHSFTSIGPGIGRLMVLYTPSDGDRGTGFFTMWAAQSTRSPEWIARTNKAYGIDRPVP